MYVYLIHKNLFRNLNAQMKRFLKSEKWKYLHIHMRTYVNLKKNICPD